MANKYRLKLSKLQFCSLVDDPAQPNAKTLLIKRRGDQDSVETVAQLAKLNEELGLAFFWAFTSTNADGTDHFDLQGDTVDQDFIKAAMEFMTDGGGAVDEMHDYSATEGRVVFAFPMTPEIAKSFGITTKQSGLMIAIKPTPDQLEKLKSGEFKGVSIAGLGTRELIKSRVSKGQLYTDEVDGHQHTIYIEEGGCWTSYATSTDAEYSHAHPVVRSDDGKLMILADSGHTHLLAAGQPDLIVVAPETIVVVAASARKGNSTTARAIHTVNNATATPSENTTMKTLEQQIADLQKRNEHLERIVKMTAAQFAHFSTLKEDDQLAFLAKSNTDRDAIVTDVAKRNEESTKVIFVSKVTGELYRASDDPRLVEMAKHRDAQAMQIEKASFEKRAETDLSHYAKSLDARAYIIGCVLKGGGTKELIEESVEALKGGDAALKVLATSNGAGADGNPGSGGSPFEALKKGLTAFCAEKNIAKVWTDGLDAFVQTPAGAELKRAHDAARPA